MKYLKHIVIIVIGTVATVGVYTATHTTQPTPQPAPKTPAVTVPSPQYEKTQVVFSNRVGPDYLYPDPKLTQGVADTLTASDLTATYTDNCPQGKSSCTYSQDHRNVPSSEKAEVMQAYGNTVANPDSDLWVLGPDGQPLNPGGRNNHTFDYTKCVAHSNNSHCYEIDHFYPLCAGGSNVIGNLWPQPNQNIVTDKGSKLFGKNFGFHQKDALETWVCQQIKAGSLDPQEAFRRITEDWVAYYLEVNPPAINFGAAAPVAE